MSITQRHVCQYSGTNYHYFIVTMKYLAQQSGEGLLLIIIIYNDQHAQQHVLSNLRDWT